jgi:hypothetical protein
VPGMRFALTRWRSKMDSNRRSRLFDRKWPFPANFRFSVSAPAQLERTGEPLASDSGDAARPTEAERQAQRHASDGIRDSCHNVRMRMRGTIMTVRMRMDDQI